MKFLIDRAKYIDGGLVAEQFHSSAPLVIYNYTPKCQFSKAWDEVTLMCRGLIVNTETHEIVARPFSKFFNYDEHISMGMSLPSEVPVIWKKLDGSLGIMYWVGDVPFIATRGSFKSEQAIWATNWLWENIKGWNKFDKRATYLFEIIYPQNRIVVNYDFSGLVLLGVQWNETGQPAVGTLFPGNMRTAVQVPYASQPELKALNTKNEEGFVCHFPNSNVRVKIKFEDYVKLH